MSYLLDTNVVSEWAKPRPDPRVVTWLAEADEDRLFLSVATFAELRAGIEQLPEGRRRQRLAEWLEDDLAERFAGRILAIDIKVAKVWGLVSARAQAAGAAMGVMDAFFAATAAAHSLALVTRNTKDFAQAGIELLNPWSS